MEQNSSNNVDFLIFGASGMQGRIVTRNLKEKGYSIIVSTSHPDSLQEITSKYQVSGFLLNLSNTKDLLELTKDVKPKVIINCAEGDWNVSVYEAALNAGSNVIDLGSDIPTTKMQLEMHEKFERLNLTAITGCGSTPGVNNVMLDYAAQFFDQIDTIEAGFAWNSNIKEFVVPFSMESILEEFIDPASIIEDNKWVDKIPMESVTEKEFRVVGKQKIFFVRHPEPYTFYENYKKKGVKNVRYYAGFPPHSFDVIASLLPNSDLKQKRSVFVNGVGEVALGDLTKVMRNLYPMPSGYTEEENLWVDIVGMKEEKPLNIVMECIVPTLSGWEEAGCNIDTGFPACIIAEMLLKNEISKTGSFSPESVVPHMSFFRQLHEHKMTVWMNKQKVGLIENSLQSHFVLPTYLKA